MTIHAGACPDLFDRGGPPLTGHIANHILRYWGGQSDFRGGPCHPRPLPEHATATDTVGIGDTDDRTGQTAESECGKNDYS